MKTNGYWGLNIPDAASCEGIQHMLDTDMGVPFSATILTPGN